MIDHTALQLALRVKAMTLLVATTGSVSLAATSTGYVRTAGSFLTDGFWPGMEVVVSGFATAANNGPAVITKVSALVLTAKRVVTTTNADSSTTTTLAAPITEAAGAGRSLVAGLPSQRAWENTSFTPTVGVPFVEEIYTRGPTAQVTLGPNGDVEALPLYALTINLPSDTGLTVSRYIDALARLFLPRTAIPVGSNVLRVRSDNAPYGGQLQQGLPGFAAIPFTIPLRIRSQNLI